MQTAELSEEFNPYYEWLSIPPSEQADYYRLLGVQRFESNLSVIENAYDAKVAFLRTKQAGKFAQVSRRLQNEITKAQRVLFNPEQRAAYDAELLVTEDELWTEVTSTPVASIILASPTNRPRKMAIKKSQVSMALLQLIGVIAGGAFAIPCAIGILAMMGMDPFQLLSKTLPSPPPATRAELFTTNSEDKANGSCCEPKKNTAPLDKVQPGPLAIAY